jgi:hypothetical protein
MICMFHSVPIDIEYLARTSIKFQRGTCGFAGR